MQNHISQNTNQKNLLQLAWMRSFAVFAQVATILFVHFFLQISLPLNWMFAALAALVAADCYSFYRAKKSENISDISLFFELLFDVFILAWQLYFSGGASNPFVSLFLLQVIIASILLQRFYAWIIASATLICYLGLSFFNQHLHAISHHDSSDSFSLHLHGMLIAYAIAAVLILVFVGKIIRNLAEKNRDIILLQNEVLKKQQLAEMGIFTSLAAHELSTPLTTIAMLLDNLKKQNLAREVAGELDLVSSQAFRCKEIINKILSTSQNQRPKQALPIKAKKAFDNLVLEWKNLRNPKNLDYKISGDFDQRIVFYDLLSQALFNIFDNALEASPGFVGIDIKISAPEILIEVSDHGCGFSEEVLQKIGRPNLSTKNSSGVGLFLAINIIEKSGGKLAATNQQKGALVQISLKL
jgi:two-component system sensor histidine kinase RegB